MDKVTGGMNHNKVPQYTVRFLIGSLDVGGTETHLLRVLPRLMTDTFKPVVITLTHPGILAEKLQSVGIPVHRPPQWVRWFQKIPYLRRIIGPPLTLMYLIFLFYKIPARLTCFYLPASYMLGMAAALLTGCVSHTVMFRRSLNEYQSRRPIAGLIERQLHRHVGRVVGNSQAVVRQLIDEENIPPEKVSLIYNGLELCRDISEPDRLAQRRQLNIADDVTVMTIVANLIPYKGHLDLIHALSLLDGETSSRWLLLSVGGGIENRPDILDLVRQKGLGDRIRWLGQVQDVTKILSLSDIGLLVSHQEGFSNSVLEGMAAGLPMIVTHVGGNTEAVIDGHCGLVVPSGNPSRLAQAILNLMNDREMSMAYGRTARERVNSVFSMDKCVYEYQQLLERMPVQ